MFRQKQPLRAPEGADGNGMKHRPCGDETHSFQFHDPGYLCPDDFNHFDPFNNGVDAPSSAMLTGAAKEAAERAAIRVADMLAGAGTLPELDTATGLPDGKGGQELVRAVADAYDVIADEDGALDMLLDMLFDAEHDRLLERPVWLGPAAAPPTGKMARLADTRGAQGVVAVSLIFVFIFAVLQPVLVFLTGIALIVLDLVATRPRPLEVPGVVQRAWGRIDSLKVAHPTSVSHMDVAFEHAWRATELLAKAYADGTGAYADHVALTEQLAWLGAECSVLKDRLDEVDAALSVGEVRVVDGVDDVSDAEVLTALLRDR